MTFVQAIKSVFSKYATFSGRARRSEYWYFYLFNVIVGVIVEIAALVAPFLSYVGIVYSLATFVPGLAVCWRRLHDIGRSGVWVVVLCGLSAVNAAVGIAFQPNILTGALGGANIGLLVIVFVWLCKNSAPGENQYGPNPKGEGNVTFTTGETKEPWDL